MKRANVFFVRFLQTAWPDSLNKCSKRAFTIQTQYPALSRNSLALKQYDRVLFSD